MNPKNKSKQADTLSDSQRVRFELTHGTAREVCVAGSFNNWNPSVTPMIRLDDVRWVKELALPPGRHEYRFVVDGQWVDDPAATERIPNSFGTVNAVLEVRAATHARSIRSGLKAREGYSTEAKPANRPPVRARATDQCKVSISGAEVNGDSSKRME